MSAIAAIIGRVASPDRGETVRRMCKVMVERGPHGSDVQVLGKACLGHNLQLFDRPASESESGIYTDDRAGMTVVLDGELYNGRDLAGELGCVPVDEQVIISGYRKWGQECLKRFRGAFSFIIWDRKEHSLFAARDFFGEKPLFYSMGGDGTITLASAVRGILRNSDVSRDIDYEAVSHYLYEKAFILPDTPLKAVKSLMHGGWLHWHDGIAHTGKYWTPLHFPEKIDDPDYVVKTYRDLMLEAIAKRMPRDSSSPGLLFSGGTDSNLLLGMMSSVTDKRITTFSVIEGMSERDLAYARKLADHFGTNHVESRITPEMLIDDLPRLIRTHVTPGVSILQAFFGTRRSREHGVNVSFTGLGVEPTLEPFWYLPYIEFLEKTFSPFKGLPETSREDIYESMNRILRGPGGQWRKGKVNRAISIVYYYFMYKRGYYRWYGSKLHPDQINALFDSHVDQEGWKSVADSYRDLYRLASVKDPHDINNNVFLNKGLAVNAVPKFESASAFNEALMRFPFLDQDVTEFTLKIHYDLKFRNGMNKFPVRENCRFFVSDECAELGKQDFVPPFRKWITGAMWPVISDVLSRDAVKKRGIFRFDRLWPMYERFRVDESYLPWVDIWAPVMLELWMRMHVDPSPTDTSTPQSLF
ncbi:MAG TPA: asparagine synthase-related protein [Candidatus Krumholzibacterium sp.]|nr:asparagine synthase-related protein [Candidatus Krumholzibacterium sp.]